MTGTSLDGLDAAVVAIKGNGLAMRVDLVDQVAVPLPAELSRDLRAMAEQVPRTTGDIAWTLAAFTRFHLESLLPLAKRRVIDLVAVHGQTVFHAPPLSWQAFAPAPLAHGLGVPVVCDLRAADLADGGQGAPITPLADLILFGHPHERRVVVNLGGFCNITRLPPGREPSAVGGGDVCACNQILDAVARQVLGLPYDRDGRRAWAGATRRAAVDDLVERLDAQSKLGRSLGTGDELTAWIDAHSDEAPDDLARSACAAIAAVIATAAKSGGAPQRLIVAGGGVRNKALIFELAHRAGCPVTLSDDLGTPATLREAMAMAVLGALCQDGVPITLSQITGAERPSRAGLWCLP
ncbi:anhydro-N-acetylmuramic acid kinase [Planctomycetota bacterium]|nr:anhydro-N-acetylmuramic acid kinase [Planctomycetota bacterium]